VTVVDEYVDLVVGSVTMELYYWPHPTVVFTPERFKARQRRRAARLAAKAANAAAAAAAVASSASPPLVAAAGAASGSGVEAEP